MVGTRRHILLFGLKMLRAALILAIPVCVVMLHRDRSLLPAVAYDPTPVLGEQRTLNRCPRSLEFYAPLWERDLKQPPIPASSISPPPIPPKESLPSLLATFVAPDGRYAHFSDGNGRVAFKTVEDEVSGFRVATIEPGRVRLINGTLDLWLEVPKPREP
ncbi:MAG: hypothetical protein AABZ47_00550 [Planctomycetota bacterium]